MWHVINLKNVDLLSAKCSEFKTLKLDCNIISTEWNHQNYYFSFTIFYHNFPQCKLYTVDIPYGEYKTYTVQVQR